MNIEVTPPDDSRFGPDDQGRFGEFGGTYVPETLMAAVTELVDAYREVRADRAFWEHLHRLLTVYVGRPSALYPADRLTEKLGGARIFLKREDLNHTGAHKINNTMGQVLLA
jgi:tryptophan synthase beta chain